MPTVPATSSFLTSLLATLSLILSSCSCITCEIGDVATEGPLLADRLDLVLGDDGAAVDTPGLARQSSTMLAESLAQVVFGQAGQVADGGLRLVQQVCEPSPGPRPIARAPGVVPESSPPDPVVPQ